MQAELPDFNSFLEKKVECASNRAFSRSATPKLNRCYEAKSYFGEAVQESPSQFLASSHFPMNQAIQASFMEKLNDASNASRSEDQERPSVPLQCQEALFTKSVPKAVQTQASQRQMRDSEIQTSFIPQARFEPEEAQCRDVECQTPWRVMITPFQFTQEESALRLLESPELYTPQQNIQHTPMSCTCSHVRRCPG